VPAGTVNFMIAVQLSEMSTLRRSFVQSVEMKDRGTRRDKKQ